MTILWAQGIVAGSVLERVANGIGFPETAQRSAQIEELTVRVRELARAPSENMRWLFLSFAESEVFVGTRFTELRDFEQQFVIPSECILTAVTQQFSFPWESIPNGWKTISLFNFTSKVPPIIDDLPIIEGWSYANKVGFLTADKSIR